MLKDKKVQEHLTDSHTHREWGWVCVQVACMYIEYLCVWPQMHVRVCVCVCVCLCVCVCVNGGQG